MSLYQIDKLDGKNYDSWSIHMKSVLIHQGYWDVVNGKEKKEDAKELNKWIERDEKALATIMLCIQASQLNHIKNCKSSEEAWNTLQEVFRPSGPIKKVYLYKQLLNTRMADDGNMSEHINNFSSIVDKLGEAGIELNEELVTIILLSSLPTQYEQFVVAMETRDNLPSLQGLKVKLLEESERKLQKDGEKIQQTAFAAKAKTQNTERNKKHNFEKRPQQQERKKGNCFVCGKQGHFAANCYSKNKKENKKEQRQLQFTVLAAAEANALKNNVWCVDSGATAHMSGDRLCFNTMRDHKEKITLAGDNHIYAAGIGDVNIVTEDGDILLRDVLYVPGLTGNFVSVSKAVDKGVSVKFEKDDVEFIYENEIYLRAKRKDNLFLFENKRENKVFCIKNSEEIKWHNRYGHLNYESLRKLKEKEMVRGLENVSFKDNINCITCMKTKISVRPFNTNNEIK